MYCGLHPVQCTIGKSVKGAVETETDAKYATSGLSADGSRRNSFLHILLASTLTVAYRSAEVAEKWLMVHEVNSPHPVQPRLDQADKANNYYGVQIGSRSIATLDPPGALAMAADIQSAPKSVDRTIRRFVRHLSPLAFRFVESGKSCELINPTSERPDLKSRFVNPSRCGY